MFQNIGQFWPNSAQMLAKRPTMIDKFDKYATNSRKLTDKFSNVQDNKSWPNVGLFFRERERERLLHIHLVNHSQPRESATWKYSERDNFEAPIQIKK